MKNHFESKNIDQLMVEADELIRQINADFIKDMKEERRLQVEKRAQHLRMIKAEIQRKLEDKEKSEISSGADGMHEAIDDLVKAMTSLKNYFV
jgi:hypothetical protein